MNQANRTKITIGRAECSDVIIGVDSDDQSVNERICVSRLHCEIEKNPCGEWALFDKGSRNGCFVNGIKVSSHVLADGDIIVLGGGGIIQSGARVHRVESIFQYKFSISAPRTPSPTVGLTGSKRKFSDESDFDGDKEGSASKRTSIRKENLGPQPRNGSEQLHDELSCGICLDVQVHPRVLACGHSFCARCISTALGYNNRCPSCKNVVVSDPQRVLALENAIDSLYKNDPEYRTRRQEYMKLTQHEQITTEKLLNVIEKARSSGKRFLVIDNKWNKEEKDIFQKGILLYKGQARVEYCRTVNLTPQYLKSATREQIAMAAFNLGLPPSCGCSMRNRLAMYIKYG